MVDLKDFQRKPPPYIIENVENLKNNKSSELPIRKKAILFQFPLNIEDKIDIALVMQKFRQQKLYSGLSAPQLGIMKRLIVFTIPRCETEDLCRTKVFLNPTYEHDGDETTEDIECCVSVKGVVGPVPRYVKIRYRTYDIKGSMVEGEATGTMARLIQHEVDHLDGKLFIDLVSPEKLTNFKDYLDILKRKHPQNECLD